MARKSLGFVFGVVLAMGVLLAITTWAASPKPQSDSAGQGSASGSDCLGTAPGRPLT